VREAKWLQVCLKILIQLFETSKGPLLLHHPEGIANGRDFKRQLRVEFNIFVDARDARVQLFFFNLARTLTIKCKGVTILQGLRLA